MMSDPINDLLKKFEFTRVLSSNSLSKTVTLLGKIDNNDAIVFLEKLQFESSCYTDASSLAEFAKQLLHNDVYFTGVTESGIAGQFQQIKVNLIYPATETHIRKQEQQKFHMISETPEMYNDVVIPYVKEMCENGRLQWVENILYNGAESERVVHQDENMVILPDMKWDGENMDTLYLVSILKRKDITSVRDLSTEHIKFLKTISKTIKTKIPNNYNNKIDSDQLRIFIHYQPSYYHFHIHIVNIAHLGMGQGVTVGKALLLDDVIDQLEHTPKGEGFRGRTLTYMLGESHELWSRFKNYTTK